MLRNSLIILLSTIVTICHSAPTTTEMDVFDSVFDVKPIEPISPGVLITVEMPSDNVIKFSAIKDAVRLKKKAFGPNNIIHYWNPENRRRDGIFVITADEFRELSMQTLTLRNFAHIQVDPANSANLPDIILKTKEESR